MAPAHIILYFVIPHAVQKQGDMAIYYPIRKILLHGLLVLPCNKQSPYTTHSSLGDSIIEISIVLRYLMGGALLWRMLKKSKIDILS